MNFSPPEHSSVRSLRLLLIVTLCLVALPSMLKASAPGWWTPNVVDSSKEANDYAAINQGQLKNLAVAAAAELNANLPGGAGDAVNALSVSLSAVKATTNDYAPVNLGQLKTVAAPFYDRLIEVGYAAQYPWATPPNPPNNSAAANIGQAKNLFSFDLAGTNAGGLPNWWLSKYGLPGNTDPNAEAANSGLTYMQKYQLNLNPLKRSTMDDEFSDGWKVAHHLNPLHKILPDSNHTFLKLRVYTVLQTTT